MMNRYQKVALVAGLATASILMNPAMAEEVEMKFEILPTSEVTVEYNGSTPFFDRLKANVPLGTLLVTVPTDITYREIHFQDTDAMEGLLTFRNKDDENSIVRAIVRGLDAQRATVNSKEGTTEVISGNRAVLQVAADKDYSNLKPGSYIDMVSVSVNSQ